MPLALGDEILLQTTHFDFHGRVAPLYSLMGSNPDLRINFSD
jgi:hypothetical protein